MSLLDAFRTTMPTGRKVTTPESTIDMDGRMLEKGGEIRSIVVGVLNDYPKVAGSSDDEPNEPRIY